VVTGHDWMTTTEVAEVIRKSPDYVARQCALGNLRAKKLGNDWRIHKDSLAAFMALGGKTPATRSRRRAS